MSEETAYEKMSNVQLKPRILNLYLMTDNQISM